MAFEFSEASSVVVGTFNMYIIQPSWLTKIGIIPSGTVVTVETKLDEPVFRFVSPKLPTRWHVTPAGVEVQTDQASVDCGKDLATILERLPETPLIAVGNNANYRAPLDECEDILSQVSIWREAPAGFKIAQRTLHCGLKREKTLFNVRLSRTEEYLELYVNAHTDLMGRNTEEGQTAARRFFDDRQVAEQLIRDLFHRGVTYAQPDLRPTEQTHGGNQDH